MRVLHVTNYLPFSHSVWGGAEMACKNVVELLAENGVTCGVAATIPQYEVKGDFEFFPIETTPDRFPAPYFFFMRHYWLQKDTVAQRAMESALSVFQPDIVHFHNFSLLTFSALDAVINYGIPAVLSIYDYWVFCPTNMLVDTDTKLCSDGHGFHCISRCLHEQFSRRSHYVKNIPIFTRKTYFENKLRKFDRIITLSENSADVMRRYGPPELEVDVAPLPTPFDDTAPEYETYDTPTVFFAGWVQARKGPDMVVKAMKDVIRQVPDARLIVNGPLCESKFEAYIRGLAESLGIKDRVIFAGKTSREEFVEQFHRSHVIVIAEQWENMSPVLVLESMAAARPVVAGAIGGIPEFIRHEKEGLLAKYDDPANYAEKIVTLLKNPALGKTLGANAATRVREICDRRAILDKLLGSYDMAVNVK